MNIINLSISSLHMFKAKIISVFAPFPRAFIFEEKNFEVLLKCCTTGEENAEKDGNCKGFQPPMVDPELIGACFFSSEICCTSKLRIEQCKLGVQAAKDGVDCHISNNRTGTEFYKNCCEACKVGLVLGAMQEECSMGVLYGIPFDDSFNYCCNEIKTTDTFVLGENESESNGKLKTFFP